MWRRSAGRWTRRDNGIGDESDPGRRPSGHLSLLSASEADLARWLHRGAADAQLLDEALMRCEQDLSASHLLLAALCAVSDEAWSEEPGSRHRLVDLIAAESLAIGDDEVWLIVAIEGFLRRQG